MEKISDGGVKSSSSSLKKYCLYSVSFGDYAFFKLAMIVLERAWVEEKTEPI